VTFEPFSASQRRGAIVVAAFALLSAVALAFIALRTIRLATVVFLQRDDSTSRPPEILFFRTQLGHYGGCLILSNMLINAAGLINFSWASRSGLSQGSICSAQAVFMQIGVWGTCWFTAALGVHTLSSLVFHVRQARWRSLAAVTIGWTTAFVVGLAPLQTSQVYGPNGSSCGITPSYTTEIFALAALPIILTAFVSTVAYSVIFGVLHGKLSMNCIRKLRGPNSSNQRGEDRFEEYHRFIGTIIWTMFWFPLAFVLLLLPFCITHILTYAGHSVSSASSVFADVCVSTLGFVNVGLLCNTFRVISPVCHGPRSAKAVTEAEKTFGNDASGDSPIVPRLQSTIPSYKNSHRTYSPTQLSSTHSRDHSWSTVNSNTELLRAGKASYKSIQTKVAPLPLNGITSPQSNTERQDFKFQSKMMVDVPLRTASLDLHSPSVSFVTGDTRHEPSTQDQQCPIQPMADTDAPTKGAKVPTFKSKAPAALNLSRILVSPLPLHSREVSNKSATLAAQLGIPDASACNPSQTLAVSSAQKLDQGNAKFSAFSPIPRIKINVSSLENVNEPNSRSSPSSVSTGTDSDSDYSGEIVHVRNVRPLPQVPHDEQDIVDPCPPSPQSMRARSQRMTMTSVWSQETGYTMSQPPDAESQAYQQLVADAPVPGAILGDPADVGGVIQSRHMTMTSVWSQETGYTMSHPDAKSQEAYQLANVLVPGVMLGDQADVGGVMSRQATSSGPRARPKLLHAISAASKLSARFSDMMSPKSPDHRPHTVVFAPNDSVV